MDTTLDDNLLTDDEPKPADLAREFTHPGYSFKGEPLRPYTAGTDLLFTQVLDRNDATRTAVMSFIFIHLQKDRAKLLDLCWDKTKFRIALLDWLEKIAPTSEDYVTADTLFVEIRESARKTSVTVIDADHPQKKTKATRRQTSPS